MTKVGGKLRFALIETLEGRQLLSMDGGGTEELDELDRSQLAGITETVAAVGATTTSLHIASSDVEEGTPVTLSASVRANDATAPMVAGSVAFFAITTAGDAPRYADFAEVRIARRGARSSEMAFVLGTAPVGSDGTARLELPSMPLGPHSIVAMFLGNDTPIFETSGDLPRISASSEPQTLVTWTPDGPEETRSWIVEPGGKGFRIRWGTIEFLDEAPEDAHSIPSAGVHLRQIYGYGYNCFVAASTWCADEVGRPAIFAPTAQPLRIVATARSGLFQAAYSYEIVPVGLPETLQDKAEDLASSASQPQLLSVKATTDLRLYLGGELTVTNPPAIMGALRRIAGPLEYLLPAVPDRGSIQSATAGLRVIVPGSGGSSGSGGITYGVMDGGFGGGSSSYSSVTNYISPRQPRILPMTGTLTFFNGDALLGSAPLSDDRSALYHAAPGSLSLGAHQIRVVYSGDAAHRAQEGSIEVQIRKTPTVVKLESSLPSGTTLASGAVLDLKATVSTMVKDLVKPTGYVKFFANGKRIGQVLLGSESMIQFRLPGGSYEITAVYAGNATMKGSRTASEAVLNFNVEKSPTSVSAIVKKAVVRRDRPIVLTPIVSTGLHDFQPRGKVVVRAKGTFGRLGSGRAGDRITLKLGRLHEGTYNAYVRYFGDESTLPSWSEMYQITVTRNTVSIAKAPSPQQPPTIVEPWMTIVEPWMLIHPIPRLFVPESTTQVTTHGGTHFSGTADGGLGVSYRFIGDSNLTSDIDENDYYWIDHVLDTGG